MLTDLFVKIQDYRAEQEAWVEFGEYVVKNMDMVKRLGEELKPTLYTDLEKRLDGLHQ